jgi:hypothetical protein
LGELGNDPSPAAGGQQNPCSGSADITAVGPPDIQAMDPSAIFGTPVVSGIAFSPARFEFPYPEGNSYKSRHARHLAQARLAKIIGGITIETVGLETGPSGPSGTIFISATSEIKIFEIVRGCVSISIVGPVRPQLSSGADTTTREL